MACPNFKKGLKMAFGPLGVKKWFFWFSKLYCPLGHIFKNFFLNFECYVTIL
jgi:hypothetical protein